MKLIALNCNHCGATLEVRDETNFVTCKHCDTQLAIHREDGAAYTALAEATKRVEQQTEALADQVEDLSDQNARLILQGELTQLDREWENRRQGLMTKDKRGQLVVATRGQAFTLAALAPLILLPLAAPLLAGSSFEMPGFAWILVAFVAAVFYAAMKLHAKAVHYEKALAAHDADREAILSKLGALHDRRPKRKKRRR